MRKNSVISLFSLFVFIIISGCATSSSTGDVKKKASFLFNCSEEKIQVIDFGNGAFGAKGCNKSAQYQCNTLSGGWCRINGTASQ